MEEAETRVVGVQPRELEIKELVGDSEPKSVRETPEDSSMKHDEEPQVVPEKPRSPKPEIKSPEKPKSAEPEPKPTNPEAPKEEEELVDHAGEPECTKITLAGYTDGEDAEQITGTCDGRPSDLALKDETSEEIKQSPSPAKSSIPKEEETDEFKPKSPESPYIPERPTSPVEEIGLPAPRETPTEALASPEQPCSPQEGSNKDLEPPEAVKSPDETPEAREIVKNPEEPPTVKAASEGPVASAPVEDKKSAKSSQKPKTATKAPIKGSIPVPRPTKPRSTTSKAAPAPKTATATPKAPTPSRIPPASTTPLKKTLSTPRSALSTPKPKPPTRTPTATSNGAQRGRSSSVKPANGAVRGATAGGATERRTSVPAPGATPQGTRRYGHVTSKISASSEHRPQGGNVRIFSEKKTYNVTSKIGSLENAKHVPGGGRVKIESVKTNFKEAAKPRINDKSTTVIKPSEKKIPTHRLNWKAESKIGSLENASHVPAGGNVKILSKKTDWKAESKVGSKDNIKHVPGGGDKKIFHQAIRINGVRSRIDSTGSSNTPTRSRSRASTEEKGAGTPTHGTKPSRRSTGSTSGCSTPLKMPGCTDPITAEQALGML